MKKRITAEIIAHEREVCDAGSLASTATGLLVGGDLSDETCAETLSALANQLVRPIPFALFEERRAGLLELGPIMREFGLWCIDNGAPQTGYVARVLGCLFEARAYEDEGV